VRRVAIGTILAALAAAASATPAHASLVYVKNLGSIRYQPSVWIAGDDGSAPRRLASGNAPRISPDGASVAYISNPTRPAYRSALRIIPAAGGASRVLLSRANLVYDVHWSPDSRHLLAFAGPELGPYRLVVIDAVTGAATTIDKGFFDGASFSPDGTRVVYSRTARDDYLTKVNLRVAPSAGGTPTAITTDGRSAFPLWGPGDRIVFSAIKPRSHDAPVFNLRLTDPLGTTPTVLTHDRVPRLLSGLTPTAFSADGTRLLAEFGGQDTSYAVTVDIPSGKEHVLGPRAENGYVGAAISKDGSVVLASTGGPDPSNRSNVVTIPYAGGKPKVLARNADLPDWNR
jgi:Tol biopolymer transport system component